MDYKEQSKMYWKMIVTLQRLLQTQYQRESDLMDQLQQCTCPENNPKYQYDENHEPVETETYDTHYIPLATVLQSCRSDLQRQVASYYYDHRLDSYLSHTKTAHKVFGDDDPNGRQKVYSIIKTIVKN